MGEKRKHPLSKAVHLAQALVTDTGPQGGRLVLETPIWKELPRNTGRQLRFRRISFR